MFRKLCIILAVFVFLGIGTCGVSKSPYPHIAPDPVYADSGYYEDGPYIDIQVNYERGYNTVEDRTIVEIYGYSWSNCARITVYINDMRVKVFDPRRDDWTTTVEFTSIPGECNVRVKGATTGWSNYCYFDGAPEGPTYALIQPTLDRGVVGTNIGVAALSWFPRGLVTIYFKGLAVDRLYPAQVWNSEITVPEVPAGLWPVEIRDESVSRTFDFEVIPSLTVEPANIAPGQLMTVVGHGFAANHYVHLTPVDKIVFSNDLGSFRLEGVSCPADSFLLIGLDEEDNSAQLEVNLAAGANVVSTAITTTEPTTIEIPSTISPMAMIVGAGILILCLIIAIVVLALRKR